MLMLLALCETSRLLESQRMELYQANQLTDQAQREKSWDRAKDAKKLRKYEAYVLQKRIALDT